MKKVAFVVLSALFLASGPLNGRPASPSVPADVSRSINVNGEAVIYVIPDEAIVRLGIETFDPSLAIASAANGAIGIRIVKALRALGLEEKYIQADHAEMEIVYPKDGVAAGVAGYRVRRAYALTVRDVHRLDEVIGAALKNGANHLEGYELRTTELRKHRDDARKRAITAAREKAEALAGELGCTLGAPRSIGESYYGWFGTRGSWGSWGYSASNQMTQNVSFSAGGSSGEGSASAPLGQIGVRAQVGVTFDLIPGGGSRSTR
jgi:uncharacterized protein YggE